MEIDERVNAFLDRPIEGDWPYVWLDATYVKVRRDHQIVSVAVIIAVGVNTDGRREVLGMTVGHSEAEPFWVEFLRSLARRGLRGTKLVISDAHEGLKAAISKILSATWQRCRVHFMRNALAYAGKTQRRIVSAWVGTAFAQDDAEAARKQWREVADQALAHDAQLVPHAPPAATLAPGDDLHHAVHRHTSSTNLKCTLRWRAGHTQAADTGRLRPQVSKAWIFNVTRWKVQVANGSIKTPAAALS